MNRYSTIWELLEVICFIDDVQGRPCITPAATMANLLVSNLAVAKWSSVLGRLMWKRFKIGDQYKWIGRPTLDLRSKGIGRWLFPYKLRPHSIWKECPQNMTTMTLSPSMLYGHWRSSHACSPLQSSLVRCTRQDALRQIPSCFTASRLNVG